MQSSFVIYASFCQGGKTPLLKSLSFKTHKNIDQLRWFLSKITGKHANETANWNHHSTNNWDTCLECNTETLAYTEQVFVCLQPYESQQILFDHVFRAHNAKCMQSSLQLWCSEILTLLESKSTSQTSSGSLKLFLYGRKLAGTPMMNGVGARSSCKIKRNIII